VVYAIAVESIERRVDGARQTAALINALGGQAEAPSMAEAQREFDEWLLAEPDQVDSAEVEWRQVMGLAG
jgi:hypothetical protein